MADDRTKKIEEEILVLKNQLTTVSDSDVLARIEVKIILLEEELDEIKANQNVKPTPISLAATDEYGNEIDAPYTPERITTVSTVAQGNIENTGIAVSNLNRAHACDTTLFVHRQRDLAKIAEQAVQLIRDAIKYVMDALGINPGSNALIEQIKQVKRYIDDVTEFLTEVQEKIVNLIEGARKIGALIQYLLSLPAEILAYFQGCLLELYAELKKQFMDAIATVSDGFDGGDDGILKSAQDVLNSTKTLVATATKTAGSIASLPAATVSAITNPGTTPLTGEQASALSKELFSSYENNTTYELA
jgi:DNA repair exonuclease SbcCD ATPase subunit